MEEDDPQLFRSIPARQTREDLKAALAARLGELPPQPETGFIGRGHELLALQRLLRDERYVVVRGQGGEGKAALAASSPAGWSARTGFVAPRSSQSRCTAVSPRCLMPSAASTCRVTPWPCSMMWNKGLKTSTASDALRVSAGSALIVVAGRLKTIN